MVSIHILRALESKKILLAIINTNPATSEMITDSASTTPVGINEKGFVNSNFGMFLLLDYCIENEGGL